MENYNMNNNDWGVFQPAVPNDTNNMNMNMQNGRMTTRDMSNNSTQRMTGKVAMPSLSLTNRNNGNVWPNLDPGTNSSSTCTGNNCSITPETLTNTDFFPAYLKRFIGYWVRLDFFMGNAIEQKVGQLLEVGASYVIIKVLEPETIMMCDLYSIKFVTVILNDEFEKLFSF